MLIMPTEIICRPTALTALKEVLMANTPVMIYWKNSVIMDPPHREHAYLVDREKGDSEKKRNYGKVLKCFFVEISFLISWTMFYSPS